MSVSASLRRAAAAAALLACLAMPAPADARPTVANDIGTGIGAGIATLVYTPVKLLWAAGGTLVAAGVFVWSAGDLEAAGRVMRAAAGGDYVVTPAHLRGAREVEFTGR